MHSYIIISVLELQSVPSKHVVDSHPPHVRVRLEELILHEDDDEGHEDLEDRESEKRVHQELAAGVAVDLEEYYSCVERGDQQILRKNEVDVVLVSAILRSAVT